MRKSTNDFYVTQGTLHHDALSYVERAADTELLHALQQGEFCYVLTSRQMGKSSLMVRTVVRLREEGVRVAILDLQGLGQNLNAEQWYEGLLGDLGRHLDLEDELDDFWSEHARLAPLQRWMRALREVVLPALSVKSSVLSVKSPEAPPPDLTLNTPHLPRLVIFIDEIDLVQTLPFSADEFFVAIRECFTRRAQDPAFERLTFCLLGVATPSDLIRDVRTTPFNIGRRIELDDFREEEAASLWVGLELGGAETPGRPKEVARRLLDRIFYWTGGHPYLTQRLCQAVAEDASVTDAAGVDRLCDELFLSARARERDDNVLFVRDRLLRDDVDRASLLELYRQVRSGRRVTVDETNPLVELLRLSGVARVTHGRSVPSLPLHRHPLRGYPAPSSQLRVRNRIYERVFDQTWVTQHMPDAELRRQKSAYRRGLLRAASIAGLVVAVMAGLTGWAVRNGRIAQANASRERAERQRGARLLYGADMQLAARAWDEGYTQRASDLLAAHEPRPGEEDLRDFNWRLQWSLLHRSMVSYAGHGGAALLGAFAPDGHLITVDEDLQLRHWNASTRRATQTLDLSAAKRRFSPALSPDGRVLAVREPSGEIPLLDTTTGRPIRVLKGHGVGTSREFTGADRREIVTLAFAADGKQLISAGEFERTVRVWDVASGRSTHVVGHIPQYAGAYYFCRGVALSPDGRTFALTENSQFFALSLYQFGKGEGHVSSIGNVFRGGYVFPATFSPDGKLLASGTWNANVWSLALRKQLYSLKGHRSNVNRVAFSPDGRIVATGGGDARVILWNATTGKELRTLKGHTAEITFLTFAPDGKRLASGSEDGTAKVWDLSTLDETPSVREHLHFVMDMAFSPDGKLLASGSYDKSTKLWAAPGEVHPVRAAGMDRGVSWGQGNGGKPRVIRTLPWEPNAVCAVAFSPDGRTLASGDERARVKLWDPASGRARRLFIGLPSRYRGAAPNARGDRDQTVGVLAFSPDGRVLAAGFGSRWSGHVGPDYDVPVKLWDVKAGRELRLLHGHRNTISGLAFSPDAQSLFTGSQDGTVKRWDTRTWQPIETLQGFGEHVMALALSPDGRMLAVGGADGTLYLRDVRTPGKGGTVTLKGHSNVIQDLAFSPDGRTLASGGLDETVKLWDVIGGRETRNLLHSGPIQALAFSPDGNTLVTGEGFGTMRFWHAAPPSEIASESRAAATASRDSPAATQAGDRRAAEAAFAKKQWTIALDHLDRRLQADPASWRDRLDRGLALAQMQRWAEAEQELARGVAGATGDAEVWIKRGSTYAELGRRDRASADFAHALEVGPGDVVVWYRRAVAELGDSETEAHLRLRAELLERVMARKPNDVEVWIERGQVHTRLHQLEQAAADYTQALKRAPDRVDPWLGRGRAYAEMGDWKRAAPDFSRVMAMNVSYTDADYVWYDHALALAGSGDVAAYRRACEAALAHFAKMNPKQPLFSDLTAICLLTPEPVGDLRKHLQNAEREAELSKTNGFGPNWWFRLVLGLAYYRSGRYNETLQQVREALAISAAADCGPTWLLLAMSHHQLGHPAEARRWLAKAAGRLNDPNLPLTRDYHLMYDVWRREAEALIGQKPAGKP